MGAVAGAYTYTQLRIFRPAKDQEILMVWQDMLYQNLCICILLQTQMQHKD